MKKFFPIFLALSLTLLGADFTALAHEGADHNEYIESSQVDLSNLNPVKREDGVIDLNNKMCLMSHKDISGKDFYVHNGVNYGFCCKMCIRDFTKAPEKFALSQETINKAMTKTA